MGTNASNETSELVKKIIRQGSSVPENIFTIRFSTYLFFDADISSSGTLAAAMKTIAETCLGSSINVGIFAASGQDFLGSLIDSSDWESSISNITSGLRADDECGGLILLDRSHKFAAYQRTPIDIGVLAVECTAHHIERALDINDCFFQISDVSRWLRSSNFEDLSRIDSYGRLYFTRLMENYRS